MRILVAEDESVLLDIIVKRLKNQGYAVDACENGEDALYYVSSTSYDLVIMDIMMPIIDGITVIKKMRAGSNNTPVLLLTARDSVEDRVMGLDAGADDYLVKPFAYEELLARIRVLLRRGAVESSDVLCIADLTLEISSHIVRRGDKEISLSSREFSVLEYMLRNKGMVLTREQIESHVWDYSFEGGSNIVDVYIRYLRRKLDDPFEIKLIHTVRGAGYTLKQ